MTWRISHRARAIKPSPTISVAEKAMNLKRQGVNVLNFGVGEPDFSTPEYIKNAGHQAITDNFTRYTATKGIPELREAICEKLLNENGLTYNPEDILVSPGAKASIFQILMTICDPRDEVLIPSPYWVSYTSQVEMADAFPVLMPTRESRDIHSFKIKPEQLEDTIQNCSNPKALILNSPNNPTGTVYRREQLEGIAEVCLKHNLLIISDEIYEKLIYDGREHISIASLSPEMQEQTVVINGVSKAYSMTGWRLGYAAGPKEIMTRAARIQSHLSSSVCSIAQKAAVAALTQDDGSVENMRIEFDKRRKYMVEGLNKIRNITCYMPKGAFYCMPNVSFYLFNNKKGINSTVELCEYLLDKYHLALVPGQAFGALVYVRFSYAASMENITEGLKRFEEGLLSLNK
ncbi:MAG: pyridoxal phosphate-dependent aminotransferase [Candidatus Cloacimonetes bacterium]|nr:pyridoxal phosphate-dependent aminotransferase [Candidatus Cloacimonadota bacterium]